MQVQNDAKPYDDINITPMLDLAYVLLVIFIIMTTATVQGQKVTRRSSTSLRFRTCSTIPGSKLPAETAMSDTVSLDVSVAGGVMPDHLRAHVEIWDRLVQELIAYLREELRDLSAKSGATPPVAPQAPERESEAKASATTTIQ